LSSQESDAHQPVPLRRCWGQPEKTYRSATVDATR
jgi:hypothetical protein